VAHFEGCVYTIRNVCRPHIVSVQFTQLSRLSAAGQLDFKRQEILDATFWGFDISRVPKLVDCFSLFSFFFSQNVLLCLTYLVGDAVGPHIYSKLDFLHRGMFRMSLVTGPKI
jgi:hypothetical protein